MIAHHRSHRHSQIIQLRRQSLILLGTGNIDQIARDQVTDVLLDLARQETRPRTFALASALVEAMAQTGGPMNRRPLRKAGFSVLKSADIPSVLVEIGFLSSKRDLDNLVDPDWRAKAARGILNGLINWRAQDDARRALVRQ